MAAFCRFLWFGLLNILHFVQEKLVWFLLDRWVNFFFEDNIFYIIFICFFYNYKMARKISFVLIRAQSLKDQPCVLRCYYRLGVQQRGTSLQARQQATGFRKTLKKNHFFLFQKEFKLLMWPETRVVNCQNF